MKNEIWKNKCIIAPSLICLDMLQLENQIQELELNGIQILHIDIIDGYFSPSMPLGFEIIKQLRKITKLAFDCHVMAQHPEFFIDELLSIGVEQIVFHVETASHVDMLINHIHEYNVRAGVALNPATPSTAIDYIVEKCDEILIMQINPGYAFSKNEQRIFYIDRKIREIKKMIKKRRLKTKISIDGRVSINNIQNYGNEIVDIFVGGTTCIDKYNISGSISKIMDIRNNILKGV